MATKKAGVRRIIYLGGLGDGTDPKLSPHLRSRHEVGRILRDSGVEAVEFRASLVIGTGTVDDVLAYLLAAKDLPPGQTRIFEVGSPDVTTYGGMIREYARQRGLRRWLILVPLLTPYLSSLWPALVTPTAFEVGRHLIEGLKNPTVVRDRTALDIFPSIQPMGLREAIGGKATPPDLAKSVNAKMEQTPENGKSSLLRENAAAGLNPISSS